MATLSRLILGVGDTPSLTLTLTPPPLDHLLAVLLHIRPERRHDGAHAPHLYLTQV